MNSPILPWIVEVRERLAEPAPRQLDRAGERRLVVLPVFVDARELWVLVVRRPEEIGSIVELGLPGAVVSEGTDPWSAARAATAMDLGLPEEQVLPLGILDELVALDGAPTLTCVAAIPHPLPEGAGDSGPSVETLPIPLTALANPQLVEEQSVEVEGEPRSLRVLHVGRRRVAGATADAIQALLQRLELG